ncbi:hypothetical protein T552_03600, partial [Pneumocystis carinii B80]
MLFSKINKIIVLGILILIVPTYGNQSTHLKTRDSQESAVNTPLKDFVVEDEDIIAYILKEDYKNENKCKLKLKEYCEELKEVDQGLNKVHTKVKEICLGIEQKCKDLEGKMEEKVEDIADLISDFEKKNAFYEECDQYFQTCMFFESTKDNSVLQSCSLLRYFCYLYKDRHMGYEVILRAFGTSIIESKDFEEKKLEICPTLIKHGDNLALICLEDISFEKIDKSINYFCKFLSYLVDNGRKEGICHEKLGIYPLLKERCKEKNSKLKGLCEEKNITYRPSVKDFNPIESEMTLLEEIDLENLYKEGRNRGLILGALERTLDDMLIRLSSNINGNDMENNCKSVLDTNCTYLRTISSKFKKLCEKKNREQKCKDISDITDRCRKFRMRLYLDGTSTEFKDGGKSRILSYDELSTSFTENECLEVISKLTYIRKLCKDDMNIEYINLMLACHKNKQDLLFIKLIGSQLYKLNISESNDEGLKECQRIVMEKCSKLKNNNTEIFLRCLRPKEICLRVEKIILAQLKDLEQVLNTVRDSPNEKDCIKLKEDCDGILKDLGLNNGKCVTLKERCEYFKVTKELKYVFFKEKSDALADNQ